METTLNTSTTPSTTDLGPEPPTRWWGDYELAYDQAGRIQIGPFALAVARERNEWRLAWERDGDPQLSAARVEVPRDLAEIEVRGKLSRIVTSSRSGRLAIEPRLADRPVVARPETTFRLLPAADIRLYVSVPLWVRVEIDDPPQEVLDLPAWRLSDTWIGSLTDGGELCFAIKVNARLRLENLPILAHRAISVVVLKNRSRDVLPLERLYLPAPHLSLYADQDDVLWTQVVCVESDGEGSMARVDIGQGPPEEARGATLVAGPRVRAHQNLLMRALSSLL